MNYINSPSIIMMYRFISRRHGMLPKEHTGIREQRGNVREHNRKIGNRKG